MAHFNFVISQNAKWGHAGFYIDCHRMTVPENILLQKALRSCYERLPCNGHISVMTPVFSFSEYIYLVRTNLLRTQ